MLWFKVILNQNNMIGMKHARTWKEKRGWNMMKQKKISNKYCEPFLAD